MKKQKVVAVMLLVLLGALYCQINIFADDNTNFGIEYEGGDLLSNTNVTFFNSGESNVTPIMQITAASTDFRDVPYEWSHGYMLGTDGICHQYTYYTVSNDSPISNSTNNPNVVISSNQYDVDVRIKSATTSGLSENQQTTVGFIPGYSYIFGGWIPYSDSQCEQRVSSDIVELNEVRDPRLFVEVEMTLHETNDDQIFTANNLYFGITDIDAAQSYKILNEGNWLSSSNMFAITGTTLQPDSTETSLKNMYVTDSTNGNYIYSEYNYESDPVIIETNDVTNIYVALNDDTQTNGLDIVYGFAATKAGSGIEFYARQHTVNYTTESNGSLTGNTTENIISGKNPIAVPIPTPDEHYSFTNWTADVDVTLNNGTTIAAGNAISRSQIRQVVVDQAITFTANFEIVNYTISYTTGVGGSLVGSTSEEVSAGANLTAIPTPTPDEHYSFTNWTADVDVTLNDDGATAILAGDAITSDQIEQVIVDQAITFTANFEELPAPTPITPNTGTPTKKTDVVNVAISVIFGIILLASVIGLFPRLTHKKVNFKKH